MYDNVANAITKDLEQHNLLSKQDLQERIKAKLAEYDLSDVV